MGFIALILQLYETGKCKTLMAQESGKKPTLSKGKPANTIRFVTNKCVACVTTHIVAK
ncbi:MAG: hypothetical protein QM534_07430 [Sediminibacterium sp.]|nr:hypothetical protein [Sediminibacterium sp.]